MGSSVAATAVTSAKHTGVKTIELASIAIQQTDSLRGQ
jgi:hypothetical protein